MKNKKTVYRRPNGFLYGIVRLVSKLACKLVFRLKMGRNELVGTSGRRILICNHEAAIDFLPVFAAVKERCHMVASNSIVMSIPVVASAAERVGVICKNQFQTLIGDMRKMKLAVDNGGLLVIFPAGMMTESGTSTPIPRATAKALKWLDADVYVGKVGGTYLTSPKWSKVRRKGKITLDIYKLASREEFAALSIEQAETLVDEHLAFDAYRANVVSKVVYKNGGNVEGLEQVLFRCPNCGEDFTVRAEGNRLTCTACGFALESDEYGLLRDPAGGEPLFRYPSDWYAKIEEEIHALVAADPGYEFSTPADIYKINPKKHRYEKAGRGTVTMNFEQFTIDGELFGEEFYQEISAAPFPILPFQPGKRFEIQCGRDIFRICPDDPRVVMQWILVLKAAWKVRQQAAVR